MLSFIKRHIFIIIVFIFTLIVSFITFLTFIGKNFILLNDSNLNYLLFLNNFDFFALSIECINKGLFL